MLTEGRVTRYPATGCRKKAGQTQAEWMFRTLLSTMSAAASPAKRLKTNILRIGTHK